MEFALNGGIEFSKLYKLLSMNNERKNPYHLFQANQQKPDIKIHLWTQNKLNVNRCDWHILAGREGRIVLFDSGWV